MRQNFHKSLYLPFQKGFKSLKMLRSWSWTKNGIQSCSLHQLKWNLLHKNNNDMKIITLSIRGISFQFRLAMKSFVLTRSAHLIGVSVLFLIQVPKHELIYVCFLNIDWSYLYKIKTVKVTAFNSHLGLIPRVVSLEFF